MHTPYKKEIPGARCAILCIHGILGSPAHFRLFFPFFPKEYSVYAVLLDGHGGTTRDFARTSMAKWKKQVDDEVRLLSEMYEAIFIVAHSMGTFFAMRAAIDHPKIKGIFLLATPLKIGVGPEAVVNALKAFFGLHSEKDAVGKAYRNAHSVALSKKPWQYLGWLPRYRELFAESHAARKSIEKVPVPCYVVQSAKDELVSKASLRYIPDSSGITVRVLPEARHFIYSDADMHLLQTAFQNFFKGESL